MKKVLIVEDNKDNLRLITYALQHAGYEVVPAETGEDGVLAAGQETPDFIIMDINLPGMDGIETTRRIREMQSTAEVPIIAITSYAMAGDRERILDAGCDGYLEKPIDPIRIVAQIEQMLTRRSP
ncbi:MAG: two-component system response regulator [Nitrospirae bacterium GWC2_57_13]|nr:MAG: two-component system response regulator [Nitrospirae bacterium GWC2_57_13]HAR46652.1 response regulator [Nitrospiraceae bacterium]